MTNIFAPPPYKFEPFDIILIPVIFAIFFLPLLIYFIFGILNGFENIGGYIAFGVLLFQCVWVGVFSQVIT
jgi:hypothetical protein